MESNIFDSPKTDKHIQVPNNFVHQNNGDKFMAYHVFNQSDAETIGDEGDIILHMSGEKYFLANTPYGHKGLYVKLSYNHGSLKRTWYYRYSIGNRIDNRQRKHPMGDVRMVEYKEVCRKHAEFAERVREGEDIVATFKQARAEAAAKPKEQKFKHVVNDWLGYKEQHIKSYSYYQLQSRVDKHILPYFGEMDTNSITAKQVKDFNNKKFKQIPAMSRHLLSYMKQLLDFAFDHDYVESNTAVGVKNKHKQVRRKAWFRGADIERIWLRLEQSDIPTNIERVIKLLILTGGRRGEWVGLQKAEIKQGDVGSAVVMFDESRTKTDIEFNVFLSKETVEKVLQPALDASGSSDFVFPPSRRNNTGHISPVNVSQYMKQILDELGINGVLHSTRASFITNCKELSFDEYRVADSCLSHAPAGTEAVYSQGFDFDKQRVLWQKWQSWVFAVAEGRLKPQSKGERLLSIVSNKT